MSLDLQTVRRVASLARLHLQEGEDQRLQAELNGILGWIEQLQAVDTSEVEPLSGAGGTSAPLREDIVNDGGKAEAVLANAPDRAGAFFAVPKVVE
ncbi:Asp-tRNA(Asn)/Glu-tRNA(Gln) amidotransferase subunit GatC [Roseomonas sp. SSH11]|uniref:Aspartyl/glutamyl-tRNA(Asn/Gln) amidotransferase subunit C n=1 Tax=Pararoseomonas baculiformis TaxID=2820812 RepID=A0ABS4AIY2_9PROT|nr:Asp-tRNA(Asn)/Glu-tRNA(Gln) amidotransferase subunit GatC [Pararoseomonas baculiformis]MBP0446831.1 Asp-tRNA(Asn)/Glu-tRNA(Gln) amidotransferase subunit GatC [Pararoseomonas baculiformis]